MQPRVVLDALESVANADADPDGPGNAHHRPDDYAYANHPPNDDSDSERDPVTNANSHADDSTAPRACDTMNWYRFWREVVEWFHRHTHHHKHRMAYITVKFEIERGGD